MADQKKEDTKDGETNTEDEGNILNSDRREKCDSVIEVLRRMKSRKSFPFSHRKTQYIYMTQVGRSRDGPSRVPPNPPTYYSNTFAPPVPTGGGPLAFFNNPIMDFSYWAPYPASIPPGIPPGLAHLLAVDCVLVMQQLDLIELFLNQDQTCRFMVLNSEGMCIFYAYETSHPCHRCCCGSNRPYQIHIKDMYQNEIIYMNRKCACSKCPCCCQCCCLTAMEIYTMPYTPIGAIIGHTAPSDILLDILDVDENVLFHVHQETGCLCIYCWYQAEFTITTIDSHKTEVGLIRKQWGGLFREALSDADVFTLNFPSDMDVRIKALFLGALFLIDSMYYGS